MSKHLTPESIVRFNLSFSIPIYQRLFSWGEREINQLLSDLLFNSLKSPKEDYYIGLLTCANHNDLVDGQQRFIFMILFGIVARKDKNWDSFLMTNDKSSLRLTFRARQIDEIYLMNIISNKDNKYKNSAFEEGLETIRAFFKRIDDEPVKLKEELGINTDKSISIDLFTEYVFKHLSFFIHVLPEDYNGKMLNKYFESMNSTGKNLEHHEILKVELLEPYINDSDYNDLVEMWNAVSDMNRTILKGEGREKKYQYLINCITNNSFNFTGTKESLEKPQKIIEAINGNQSDIRNKSELEKTSFYSFLSFTDFLLLVLYIFVEGKTEVVIQRFFNRDELRTTFELYKDLFDVKEFIVALYQYRVIYDYSIIRVNKGDYSLLGTNKEISELEQFEAMLYANSSNLTYYQWIPLILKQVAQSGYNEDILLNVLIEHDNKYHSRSEITGKSLDMGLEVNRYYFRRLDYYLWSSIVKASDGGLGELLKRLMPEDCINEEVKRELKNAVKNYRFHQYNSIEHLYPQNDEKQNNKWTRPDGSKDFDSINSFGNLALISGPFNSSQNDDPLDRKFGNIRNQIIDRKQGLMSIKMALMYYSAKGKSENWTQQRMNLHRDLMVAFLGKSYDQS